MHRVCLHVTGLLHKLRDWAYTYIAHCVHVRTCAGMHMHTCTYMIHIHFFLYGVRVHMHDYTCYNNMCTSIFIIVEEFEIYG